MSLFLSKAETRVNFIFVGIIYFQAIINLEKSLLVRYLLLIHLIQFCQKYKNEINLFDSFTNLK